MIREKTTRYAVCDFCGYEKEIGNDLAVRTSGVYREIGRLLPEGWVFIDANENLMFCARCMALRKQIRDTDKQREDFNHD